MGRISNIVTAMALASVTAFVPISGAIADEDAARLFVTGQGEVEIAPDMAIITLGVEHMAGTADQAMDEVARRTTGLVAALTKAGIASEDMQTSGLSLDPVFEDRRNTAGRAPEVIGFSARNTLRVTVLDLEGLGAILDDVVTEGANMFRGLSFGLQDDQAAQDAAMRLAVQDALAKGALLADAAGSELGGIIRLQEGAGVSPRPEFARAVTMSADAAMPVAPGTLTVRATVSVVFGLEE
ncbi:MAG: SIMPL domain-containing protein [Pseudomonadota bacterium]